MQTSLTPILRDMLIRFQQGAIKETGCRPVTFLRQPMDEDLLLPGCQRPGYSYWQPCAWPANSRPLGEHAEAFHESVRELLSLCRFLEMRFRIPVSGQSGKAGVLYHRTFETFPNTLVTPPSRVLEEAVLAQRTNPSLPLSCAIAATCDGNDVLLLQLRAEDGMPFVTRAEGDPEPLELHLGIDQLLPKLQFLYDI